MSPNKSEVAITMGDPAGIGPEVVLQACAAVARTDGPTFTIVGDPDHLRSVAAESDIEPGFDIGDVVSACGEVEPGLSPGNPRPSDSRIALDCIVEAARLALAGEVSGLVTAPVSKRGIAAIEPAFRGHTEFLAAHAGVGEPLMVFGNIRPAVALLTTHLPLATALASVRRPGIVAALSRLHDGWQRWFGAAPRIGVAGLNPHAGEQGLLGREEQLEVAPAIVEARADGVDVHGPYPADSVFRRQGLDVVLALYHDQGTIMAKRAQTPSVNMTFGLPYARTSPDHGVAYDIAGTGAADPRATEAAIRLAGQVAAVR